MTDLASLSIPPDNGTETLKSATPAYVEKDGTSYHYEKRHRHHHHPPEYYSRYEIYGDGNGSPYEDFTYDAEDFSGPFSDDSESDVICAPKANGAGLDLQPTEMEDKNDADEKAAPEQDGISPHRLRYGRHNSFKDCGRFFARRSGHSPHRHEDHMGGRGGRFGGRGGHFSKHHHAGGHFNKHHHSGGHGRRHPLHHHSPGRHGPDNFWEKPSGDYDGPHGRPHYFGTRHHGRPGPPGPPRLAALSSHLHNMSISQDIPSPSSSSPSPIEALFPVDVLRSERKITIIVPVFGPRDKFSVMWQPETRSLELSTSLNAQKYPADLGTILSREIKTEVFKRTIDMSTFELGNTFWSSSRGIVTGDNIQTRICPDKDLMIIELPLTIKSEK
ncbi:hypothetical protein Cpir12675_002923 [Ceratocystis pirilliformis]|uniref:Uncharacterized protein n=1 Tax=Ceratocystis pirilliformis TaxID=259994 RepID=A0ABR3Z6G4_9PEZI